MFSLIFKINVTYFTQPKQIHSKLLRVDLNLNFIDIQLKLTDEAFLVQISFHVIVFVQI